MTHLCIVFFFALQFLMCNGSPIQASAQSSTFHSSVKCETCRVLVKTMEIIWGANLTEANIGRAIEALCERFHITEALVCQGMVGQFRDEFLYVVGQLILEPTQLCGFFFTNCGLPFDPFDSSWNITLPPKPHRDTLPMSSIPNDGPRLRVLQLSDLHFDRFYQPGSEASCGSPICCHQNGTRQVKKPAGYWGTNAACDLPYWSIENLFQHLNRTEKVQLEEIFECHFQFDYIIMTGDLMSHTDWAYSREEHLAVIANLSALFEQYLPNIPVFWSIGNHEGVPVNNFAPKFAPRRFRPDWLYEGLERVWNRWLPDSTDNSVLYRGSYSVRLAPGLRLISLNTGYCEKTNFLVYLNQTDPDGSLTWLVAELFGAEQTGEKVQIIAHIPPGNSECLEGWARNYYRIVNRFAEVIVGQFFGHIHVDCFTLFFDDLDDSSSRPTEVLYAAPSVTTFVDLNPAYRIYTIDGIRDNSSFEVLDHETYFFNLSLTNATTKPQWELLYSAKAAYGLADLQPDSWQKLMQRITEDEKTFQQFLRL